MSAGKLVRKCLELEFNDKIADEFKEIAKEYQTVTRLDLVQFFEKMEVPKFYNPTSWVLEECFKMLLQQDTQLGWKDFDGCDMDVKNNFDETLLIHTIKTFK